MIGHIDYQALGFWWQVIISVLIVLNTAYTWIVNRSKVNTNAIQRVNSRVTHLSNRLGQIETDMKHLPDHKDIGDLHEKVNIVAKGMEGMQGELRALNRNLGLINEHLLNGGKP